MARKNDLKNVRRSTFGQPSSNRAGAGAGPMTEWFTKHISRRSLGKGLAWGAVLAMAGVTVYQLASDDDPEVSADSLDLQKKEGWNVGSTDKPLVFDGSSQTDSRGRAMSGADPNYLISVYQPRDSRWQPFFVPTLIQSLSQTSLSTQLKPVVTGQMSETYQRADALRNLISQTPNPGQTMIISELPGAQSIALGAAMADTASLVPVFDNWPHPLGVVRSHETLGAMAYYAGEIDEKRSKLKENAPALMLLDSNRLTAYTDQDTQFDNRYLAKLPPADQIKQRGVQQVIYLVKDQSQTEELDDINDDLVEWQKQGINVRMLRLSDFKPVDEPVQTASAGTTTTTVQRHYYYGGAPYGSWLFFSNYGYSYPREVVVYRDGRNYPISRPPAGMSYDPPGYRPASRPTIFSSSRVGGVSGVGKTRPSGFGRTSVRMSSDGRVTGTRVGRSGSYGRSGGGWFGG
ncbi:MAG TPA: hypothetical protein VJ810_26565 [Blastocatellia bacterium]|nr:hypothetical protein [Blastocatellia bacterium]